MRAPILVIIAMVCASESAVGQSQQKAPQATVELPPALARVLTDYEEAWRDGDARALSELFAEDGFVLPSWSPPIQGRQLIEEHYAESSGTLLLRAIAYATDGKVGYIVGGYRYREGPDAGKFTLTLQLDVDGRWLIMSDMDNSNRRAP